MNEATETGRAQAPIPEKLRRWLTANLMGVTEIRNALISEKGKEISRQYAYNLTKHPRFPKPVAELAMGPLWLRPDFAAFQALERPDGVPLSGRHASPQEDPR